MYNTQQRDYWPTRDWKTKTPQEVDISSERLNQLHDYAQSVEPLHSILIVAITSSSEPGPIQSRIIMNDFVLPAVQ